MIVFDLISIERNNELIRHPWSHFGPDDLSRVQQPEVQRRLEKHSDASTRLQRSYVIVTKREYLLVLCFGESE
jgi:hypothetical protein